MKRQSFSQSYGSPVLENLENRQLFNITTSVVAVPITQAELTADPTLANYNTWDIQVTVAKGERWLSCDMDAELTSGSFYNVPSSGHGSDHIQSNLWPLSAALIADTAVSASNFSQPVILGSYLPATQSDIFSSTETNVTWGALDDQGTGTFTVARLTVSKDANGDITGDDDSTFFSPDKPLPFHFSVINGQIMTTSSISGTVYSDGNVDGADDNGEGGIAGVTVYLDKNQNGKLDTGEKKLITDSNGDYEFDDLTPGTYYVREVTPAGYRLTAPSKTDYVVALGQGVNGTGKSFGNTTRALVSGTVFNDANSNKKWDTSTEKGLSGFTVWIDLNNDGKLDAGDESVVTDVNGNWSFGNIVHGTYTIHISSKTGYKNTTPSSFSIKLAAAQVSTEHFFGVHKT